MQNNMCVMQGRMLVRRRVYGSTNKALQRTFASTNLDNSVEFSDLWGWFRNGNWLLMVWNVPASDTYAMRINTRVKNLWTCCFRSLNFRAIVSYGPLESMPLNFLWVSNGRCFNAFLWKLRSEKMTIWKACFQLISSGCFSCIWVLQVHYHLRAAYGRKNNAKSRTTLKQCNWPECPFKMHKSLNFIALNSAGREPWEMHC